MKSTYFTPMLMFFIVLLQSKPCQSQVFFQDKPLHKVWVSLYSKSSKTTGILYEIKDSSILVSNSYYRKDYTENKYNTQDLQINDIKNIKVLESHNYLEGAIYGAIPALAIGVLIAFIDGKDPPGLFSFSVAEKAIIYGSALLIPGVIIGASLSSIKLTYSLNGNKNKYDKFKTDLKKYSLMDE